MSVILVTSKGDLTFDLHVKKCPVTCENFLGLCRAKYYNNCLFFDVQKDFIIRSGDPSNTGKGGNSIFGLISRKEQFFKDEFHPNLKHNKFGTLSMVNFGKDRNGSQFLVTATDRHLDYLDGKHSVFGELVEGVEVLKIINNSPTHGNGKPFQVIRIKHTIILFDPSYSSGKILSGIEEIIPPKSPHGITEFEGMINEDEELEGVFQKPELELKEFLRKKDQTSKAMVLEMVEDIPSFDVSPPKNVLFVCKLNPVTREDDLEIIFSRSGKVDSCEIIRDPKTGDSLGYGFVEFKTERECEIAYLKMQNIIVDDRAIKVDFSQSVAKLWKKHFIRKRKREGSESSSKRKKRKIHEK